LVLIGLARAAARPGHDGASSTNKETIMSDPRTISPGTTRTSASGTVGRGLPRTWLAGAALAGAALLLSTAPIPVVAADAASSIESAASQPASGSLARAVRTAEGQTGGRAKEAKMDLDLGIVVYRVETVSNDGTTRVVVETASGNVLKIRPPKVQKAPADTSTRPARTRPPKHQATLGQLQALTMTLADAIDMAEAQVGAVATQAELRHQRGSTVFEVRLVKDRTSQRVHVNPQTNTVVPVVRQQRVGD
jgi:uncharacterized membrane protein YkoI